MGLRGYAPKNKPRIEFGQGVPPPPPWLDESGRKEYRRCASELKKAGAALQKVDLHVLANYAQAAADSARLTEQIRQEGEIVTLPNGIRTAHPLVAVRTAAQKHMLACAAKLGFSPADRSRVPFDKAKVKNEFSQFLHA